MRQATTNPVPSTNFCTSFSPPTPSDPPLSAASSPSTTSSPARQLHLPSSLTLPPPAAFPSLTSSTRPLPRRLPPVAVQGEFAFVLAPNSPQFPVSSLTSSNWCRRLAGQPSGHDGGRIRAVAPLPPRRRLRHRRCRPKAPIPLLLHTRHLDAMLACAGDGPGDAGMAITQSELAAILYSSGTSGLVKGVVLTHLNLIASIASFCSLAEEHQTSPHVNLKLVPLFHVPGDRGDDGDHGEFWRSRLMKTSK